MNRFGKIFSKHYKIERFSVLLLAGILCITLCVGSIFIKVRKDDTVQLSNQAMYTVDVTMSLSGTKGTVENIFTNSNNTRVFVLLKFDDMSNMSVDAADYELFLTGVDINQKHIGMSINPAATLYVFGSTGYVGIDLAESRGFSKEILYLALRSNAEYTTGTPVDEFDDSTYTKFDQCRVYFNGSGSDAPVSTVLDNDKLVASDLYRDLVIGEQEDEIRDTLTEQLSLMRVQLELINKYTKAVEDAGVQIPEIPIQIAGDSIRKETYDDGTSVLYLDTDYVFAKGYDFEWQDSSIADGYMNEVTGGLSYDQWSAWFAEKNLEKTDAWSTQKALNEFYYISDGSQVIYDSLGSTPSDKQLKSDMESLIAAWNAYKNLKSDYQTKYLYNLLLLEVEVTGADAIVSVNNSSDILTNW